MKNPFKSSEWKYPKDWPQEDFFCHYMDIKKDQILEFEKLVESNVNERIIDAFIKNNPNILANCLKFLKTGNHGAWVIPQQQIKPSVGQNNKGQIPDYILGGCSSDGFSWFILELKGVEHKMFKIDNNKKLNLSSILNSAVCQTLEYIDYCAEQQSYLRDGLKLNDFREPRGLILIGRESEVDDNPRLQKVKSSWNRYLGSKIEIRTYDSLLRIAKKEYSFQNK
ncbi:MAG TPA: DUF4263 domain-containing protein [Candidatus Competibacteraceae bacterium]|nr:DUF4263 domain-containing protein [Candidatus Competibacteraceae bacterium]